MILCHITVLWLIPSFMLQNHFATNQHHFPHQQVTITVYALHYSTTAIQIRCFLDHIW